MPPAASRRADSMTEGSGTSTTPLDGGRCVRRGLLGNPALAPRRPTTGGRGRGETRRCRGHSASPAGVARSARDAATPDRPVASTPAHVWSRRQEVERPADPDEDRASESGAVAGDPVLLLRVAQCDAHDVGSHRGAGAPARQRPWRRRSDDGASIAPTRSPRMAGDEQVGRAGGHAGSGAEEADPVAVGAARSTRAGSSSSRSPARGAVCRAAASPTRVASRRGSPGRIVA